MKLRLVSDWRQAWCFASVRLAAIAGVLAALLAANPALVLGLIGMLPTGPLRTLAAVAVGFVVFVIPTITRLLAKEKKDAGPSE